MMSICVDEKVSYSVGDTERVACHVVVAVPDLCIQELLQMALHLWGYQVTCTPIDLLHPLSWLAPASRAQPDALIVDLDFFRFCSVQQSMLAVLGAWPQRPGGASPGWVWLSRRPFCRQLAWVIGMPFRLARLEACVQEACQSRQHAVPSTNERKECRTTSEMDVE